jgi:hypothetical protein
LSAPTREEQAAVHTATTGADPAGLTATALPRERWIAAARFAVAFTLGVAAVLSGWYGGWLPLGSGLVV